MKSDDRVYIGYIDSNYTGGEIEVTDLVNKQFFSKGFWDYFTRRFPRSTITIFYSHLLQTNPFIKSQDTSVIVEAGDYGTFTTLYNNLPKTADGKEKVDNFLPTPFFNIENSHNSTSNNDTLVVPVLTDTIAKEYLRFLDAIKDKRKPPVFVFKKDFLNNLSLIYKKATSS